MKDMAPSAISPAPLGVVAALAIAVLVGAGLLVRTMQTLLKSNLGFDSNQLITATVSLPSSDYAGTAKQAAFIEQGIKRIQNIPGVTSASAIFPATSEYR